MLIFGSEYIESSKFVKVVNEQDIEQTTPKDILLLSDFTPPYNLAKYCQKNELAFAIEAKNILDAIYANSFDASFVIADFKLAKELQTIANEYLWDMKVLAKVTKESDLEIVAKAFIDGAIFFNFEF